jgi:hypothetical protein
MDCRQSSLKLVCKWDKSIYILYFVTKTQHFECLHRKNSKALNLFWFTI